MMDRLLTGVGMAQAVREGLEEFESGSADITQYGMVAYLFPRLVIVDDMTKDALIGLATVKDFNLDEHGVTIFRKGKRWRFDYGGKISGYLQRLDERFGLV